MINRLQYDCSTNFNYNWEDNFKLIKDKLALNMKISRFHHKLM